MYSSYVFLPGTVMGKSPKGVVVQLKGPIKRGDGIVLDRGKIICYKGL